MKTFYSAGYFRKPVLFLLLSLMTLFVFAASAFALTGNKIDQCYDCHGSPGDNRPWDAAYRNISSGAFPGNHQTHMASTATASSCVPCHNNSGFTIDHRNGKIQFAANVNTSPATGKYMKYGFQAFTSSQVSNATLGTCATVNCHFEHVSPTWGASSATTTCASCHATTPSSYSHNKHVTVYPIACTSCHPSRTTFSHATSAGDRSIAILPAMSYNGTGNGNSYLPSQDGPARIAGFGTCSNIYCHSNGTSNTVFTGNVAPKWSNTLTCESCHNFDANATKKMSTYSHTQHINNASLIGANITCDKCHNTTTTNGISIASTTVHANSLIDVKFPGGVGTYSTDGHAPGGTLGSCSATYCHSTGKTGVTPAPVAPTWGATWSNKCNGCHGTTNALGAPDYTNAGQALTNANSHEKHAIVKAINCAVCHQLTTTTGTSILGGSAKHLDGGIQDVSFGAFNGQTQTGASYIGGTTKSCSATYCHSTGVAIWGGSPLACNGCHGDSTTLATGKHAAHTNPTFNAWLGAGSSVGCVECHASVVTNNTTISTSGASRHVNGMKDYSGAKAPRTTFNSGAGTCTTYCHSNGKGTPKDPGTWAAGAAINSCKGCHGATTSNFGEPDYASVGVGLSTSNSHGKHVTAATDCVRCHVKTASEAGNAIVTGSVDHIDRTIDARFSRVNTFTSYSGAYNAGARSCSATYCHGGNKTTPAWGAASLNCNSCHRSVSSATGLPAGHTFHLMSTAGNYNYTNAAANTSTTTAYNFTCSSCHGATITNHAKGPQASGSDADIFFGFSSAGRGAAANSAYVRQTASSATDTQGFKYTPGGAGNCNNTYCHSDGNGANGINNAITWGTTQSGAGLSCTTCHGDATTVGKLLNTNYHQNHVNKASTGGNLGCVECHAKTVIDNTTISNKANHVNKFKDFSGARTPKASLLANGTCSTYCHSSGQATPTMRTVTSWRTAGSVYTCKSCHGADTGFTTQFGEPNYLNVSSAKNSWNSHTGKHISAAVSCKDCHATTTTDGVTVLNNGIHLNGSRTVAFDTTQTRIGTPNAYDYVNKTCSNVKCHSNGKGAYVAPRWGGKTNCKACHPTLGGAHARHTGGFNGTNGVPDWGNLPFYAYTSNKSYGSDATANYALGCANCHPITAANHADGNIDVTLDTVGNVSTLRSKNASAGFAGTTVGTNTLKCQNVYCHSDGKGGQTTTLAWNQTYAAIDRCAQCHGNSPADATHQAHVAGSIHQDDIFNGTSGKLGTGSTGSVSHGIATQATTISCNICHANTVTSARNDQNTLCVTCHVSTNTVGATYGNNATINNLAMHVNSSVDVAFAGTTIVSKAQLRPGSFVNYTGGVAGWKRNQLTGVDQYKTDASAYDYAKGTLSGTAVWSAGAQQGQSTCSNVVCHNMKPGQAAVKWSDTLTCDSCHTSL